jgi:hypothetical protein
MVRCEDPPVGVHDVAVAVSAPATAAAAAEGIPPAAGSIVGPDVGGGGGAHETGYEQITRLTAPPGSYEATTYVQPPLQVAAMPANDMMRGTPLPQGEPATPNAHRVLARPSRAAVLMAT